jgi:hypothetical protein
MAMKTEVSKSHPLDQTQFSDLMHKGRPCGWPSDPSDGVVLLSTVARKADSRNPGKSFWVLGRVQAL